MKDNPWVLLLAYVTGLVNQELLLKNGFLAAENRILRAHLPTRLRLSDLERSTLAEIGKRLGRKALAQVACVAKPDTILAWYRKLIARKFDGSQYRSNPGRQRVDPKLEALMVQMARENAGWGSYPRGTLQFRLPSLGSNDRQYLEAALYRPGPEAQPEYNLEGIHSVTHGGFGWY